MDNPFIELPPNRGISQAEFECLREHYRELILGFPTLDRFWVEIQYLCKIIYDFRCQSLVTLVELGLRVQLY